MLFRSNYATIFCMKSGSTMMILIWVVIGAIVLLFMSSRIVSHGDVPSLSKYIAENGPKLATSSPITFFPDMATTSIRIENSNEYASTTILAVVADNKATEEQGLSGVITMPDDRGMLFVFFKPDIYSFWMKDMNFSLDMIWIDSKKKVVDVSGNISPETFPKTFSPSAPVSYVLEINAGLAERYGIKKGTVLDFSI